MPGGRPIPGGSDMAGMSEQEQQITKAVRGTNAYPSNPTSTDSVTTCSFRQPWKAALARPLCQVSWASPSAALLDFSCPVYEVLPPAIVTSLSD